MVGARQQEALNTIEADYQNVRLAWQQAIVFQDLTAVSLAIDPLYRFFWNHANHSLAGIHDFEKAIALFRAGKITRERGIILGRLLGYLGWFYQLNGKHKQARPVAEESLMLLQQLDARAETIMPMLCLGIGESSLEKSNHHLQESLALAQEIGNQWAIGDALYRLGINAESAGNYEKAEQQYRKALAQFEKNGDGSGASWMLTHLSNLAVEQGRYEEALELALENKAKYLDISLIPTLYSLGIAFYHLGDYEKAEAQFQQRLAFMKEKAAKSWVPENFYFLGNIAFKKGELARATQLYQESLAGAHKFNDLLLMAQSYDGLSRLFLAQGDNIRAKQELLAALKVINSLDQPDILSPFLITAAEFLAAEGDLAYAYLLAMVIVNQPVGQARAKEHGIYLMGQLEDSLSTDILADIRQHSQQNEITTVTDQLLINLDSH